MKPESVVLRVPVPGPLARRLARMADSLGLTVEGDAVRAIEGALPTMELVSGAARRVERCPRCGGDKLREGARGAVHLAACVGCGGVWLDNASAQAMLERPPEGIEEISRRVSTLASGKVETHGRLECPVCEAPMERSQSAASEVSIDGCRSHGVFFDAGELERCVAAVRRRVDDARTIPPEEVELSLGSLLELAQSIRDDVSDTDAGREGEGA